MPISPTTAEQKRAANNLIEHNWGFYLPRALVKRLTLEQIRRIIAILSED